MRSGMKVHSTEFSTLLAQGPAARHHKRGYVVPPISALSSASPADLEYAARMLGDAKLGRIAVGCYADLLVLDADPSDDVTVLDYPEKHLFAIIQGGRVVSSRIDGLPVQIPM